jgi:tetratricopeptide (TPR) repeat protein
VKGLLVTARSSSFQFKGKNEDLRVIGATLGVNYVVEGSVRRDDEQLRISAQLLDASSGFQLWSETYDRDLESLFEVQDDISENIVSALEARLGLRLDAAPRELPAASHEAHDALLLGRHLVAQRTLDAMQRAVQAFERAIELDPDYALAHAELAMAIRLLSHLDRELSRVEARSWAEPHAERAMALGPNLAEAHAAMAWFQDSKEQRREFYEQAIRINPSYSIVHTWLGRSLKSAGREQEAFTMLERAVQLDPLSIPGIGNYVLALIDRNRLDEASMELEKLSDLAPDNYANMRGLLASVGGEWAILAEGALAALQFDPSDEKRRALLARRLALLGLESEVLSVAEQPPIEALHLLGRPGDAVRRAEALWAGNPEGPWRRRDLGRALAAAGEYERARPLLEALWQESSGHINRASSFRGYEAAALIAIRRAAGEKSAAAELLMSMRDYVQLLREAGISLTTVRLSVDYLEGLTAFLSGERETGLALIARSVEDGAFEPPNTAFLQELYEDPGFAPILALQQERQARERERFLTVVCNDNPYGDAWQPAASTCMRYLDAEWESTAPASVPTDSGSL